MGWKRDLKSLRQFIFICAAKGKQGKSQSDSAVERLVSLGRENQVFLTSLVSSSPYSKCHMGKASNATISLLCATVSYMCLRAGDCSICLMQRCSQKECNPTPLGKVWLLRKEHRKVTYTTSDPYVSNISQSGRQLLFGSVG